MKKRFAVFLCVLLFPILFAVSASADDPLILFRRGTPDVDGVIDGIWASADRQEIGHLKAGDLKGKADPDCRAFVSALWDDDALYFLFEIEDNDFSFLAGAGDWKNDAMYVYLNETGSMETPYAHGQAQLAFIPHEGLSLVPRNGSAPVDSEVRWSYPSDASCVIEVKLEPAILDLTPGAEFFIDFQYNDANDACLRDFCLGWADRTDAAATDASVWGTALLAGDPAENVAAADEADTPSDESGSAPTDDGSELPAEEVTDSGDDTAEEAASRKTPATAVVTLILVLGSLAAFAVSRFLRP